MSATLKEILSVVDEKIRPKLHAHGGDISIIDYDNGFLRVEMKGMCKNCPSAMITLEDTVKAALDGLVEDVCVVATVDEELLDFAKSILKKKRNELERNI